MTNESLYPCFYDNYRVTKSGRIYSDISKRFLKIKPNMYGYMQTVLIVNGLKKNIRVHRLIAMTFIKNNNPKELVQVNHINGVKSDNRVDNLEWVTNQQNAKHAYDNKLSSPFKASDKNKKELIDIVTGKIFKSITEASAFLNIKRSTLSMMLTGKNNNTTNLKYHVK